MAIKFIDQLFDISKGHENATILGTGPSADRFKPEEHHQDLILAINRAIILSDRIDCLFIDSIATYKAIKPFLSNTKYLLMPLFSTKKENYSELLELQEDTDKVYFFVWTHWLDQILSINSELNSNLLYVDWGNVQAMLHFISKLEINSVSLYGIDGGEIDNRWHALKVVEHFGETRQPLRKLRQDYARTQEKLSPIAEKLGLRLLFK